jgi:hypothetical protein
VCSRQSIKVLAAEVSGVEMGNFGILTVLGALVNFMILSFIISII